MKFPDLIAIIALAIAVVFTNLSAAQQPSLEHMQGVVDSLARQRNDCGNTMAGLEGQLREEIVKLRKELEALKPKPEPKESK